MVITIDELLKTRFYTRTREEKVRIIMEGKPRPPLGVQVVEENLPGAAASTVVLSIFDIGMYDQVEWLTACNKRQKCFCWPCALFDAGHPWNGKGYNNLAYLTEEIKAHEKSIPHIQSVLDMQMFCEKHMFQNSVSANQIKDLVIRNRNIMKRIIDVVCVLIDQQRAPRAGSKDKNALRLEDCLESLEFLRDYDTEEANMVGDAIDVLQISPNVLTDLVDAMTRLLKSTFQKEIDEAKFVSMILSGHFFDGVECRISTVLRYLHNGKVCERFLGFTTLDGSPTSNDDVLKHILKVTAEYEISPRLIAITFDGAVLPDKNLINQFLKQMSSSFPYALFVPCYLHKLDEVLLQSLSTYKECDFFFKTTRAIGSFLCKDAKIRQHFENFIHSKISGSERLDFVNYTLFFSSMKTLRRYLIEYFDVVLDTSENWKAEDLAKVIGFRRYLSEFKTIFLLEMFIKLFTFTSDICNALNSKMPETAFENNMIDDLVRTLESEKETGFEDFWKGVMNFEMEEEGRAQLQMDKNIQDVCRASFVYNINSIVFEIRNRFKHATELEFFHLLNPTKYKKCIPIRDYLSKLKELYGGVFDGAQMRNELKVLYANPDLIGDKSAYELLELFIEADLKPEFENVYKLTEIVLTMPCKPPPLDDSSSKLDKINTWCHSFDKKELPGDLSVLCVEMDYFMRLRNRYCFYDDVISKFQELNNSLDLLSCQ